jgi:hypothetical protein
VYSICAFASLCCHTLALDVSELSVDGPDLDSSPLDLVVIPLLIRERRSKTRDGVLDDLNEESRDTVSRCTSC